MEAFAFADPVQHHLPSGDTIQPLTPILDSPAAFLAMADSPWE